MILPEQDRIAKYTRDYFTKRKIPEIQSWHKRIIRPDIAACLCYTLGYTRTKEIDNIREMSGMPYKKHLSWIGGRRYRNPKLVVDVGTGRGEIPALFSLLGIDTIGIDPSPGAQVLFSQTMKEWAGTDVYNLFSLPSDKGLEQVLEYGLEPDTIIMCESIEHIREDEFERAWKIICRLLRQTEGLFVVANRLDFHPISKDGTGYDHIRRVDNVLYDRLAKDARKVLVRRGSHLVLQFG